MTVWCIYVKTPEYAAATSTLTLTTLPSESVLLYETDENHDNISTSFRDLDSFKNNSLEETPHKFNNHNNNNNNNKEIKEEDHERTQRLKEIYYQTAISLQENDYLFMLQKGNWVEEILTSIEASSLSVSIAIASSPITGQRYEGFPLVYVNKAFEKTTLYSRNEILGKSCKFLQSEKTEMEQMQKITEALSKGESIKIAMTNVRKDRSEFLNFLALRPVFSAENTMLYVIAVQYDISKEEASLREIKMVEDFLALMCTIMQG
jgi:PAS domain S-box-containing protein